MLVQPLKLNLPGAYMTNLCKEGGDENLQEAGVTSGTRDIKKFSKPIGM